MQPATKAKYTMLHIFDKFMYLLAHFAIYWTKMIQPYNLMYGGWNLLLLEKRRMLRYARVSIVDVTMMACMFLQ
jgi:hypothetical protein